MKNLYCIVGPSGSGKTTLGQYLKENKIPEIVSHTTREKRFGEVDGIHYYFVNKEEFNKITKIEYSEYAGNFYCVSLEEIENKLEQNDKVFVIVDFNGYKEMKKNCKKYNIDIKMIYIKTDLKTMHNRMIDRGDSLQNIEKRLKYVEEINEFDNEQYADFVIDNRYSIENSYKMLDKIFALK